MTRTSTTTATLLGGLSGLGVIAGGRIAKAFAALTNNVVLAFEDVLDDEWGAPGDGGAGHRTLRNAPALVA